MFKASLSLKYISCSIAEQGQSNTLHRQLNHMGAMIAVIGLR